MRKVIHSSRILPTVLLCLVCPCVRIEAQDPSSAYGTVAGSVIDSYFNRGLPDVAITVRGTTLGTKTDAGGQYKLEQVPPGQQVLVFSKSGYVTVVVTEVRVAAGQISKVDNQLKPEYHVMDPYVVTAPELEEEMAIVFESRFDDLKVMETLGEEFFGRSGAGDAGEAATKIVGVTVQEGKFIVVRGLAERYNNTFLNGAVIPSPDPDKKAVQLDIFPTDAIERLETSKTFTPDLPGDFAGGSLNIVTKRFPEAYFFNVSVGVGYNTSSTFNDDFLTYHGGDTDWAGFDDGTRDIPSSFETPAPNRSSDLLNATRSGGGRTPASRTAAAQQLIALTKEFDDQLYPYTEAPPPDVSFSAAIGNKTNLFSRPLGFLVGVNYDRKFRFYDDGIFARYNAVGTTELRADQSQQETRSVEQVSWGSLVNLAYQVHENHQLAFNFIYNRNSDDEVILRQGFDTGFPDDVFNQSLLHYTERELISYQLLGTHEFPDALDMKTEWLAALSNVSQDEPDYRVFEYVVDSQGTPDIPISGLTEPTRFYREIEEENNNLKLDHSIPFTQWSGDEGKFKFGGFYSDTERKYRDRRVAYNSNTSPRFAQFASSKNPSLFLDEASVTFQPRPTGAYLFNVYAYDKPFTRYDGTFEVSAGYGMVELPLYSDLKLVGGARYEKSELTIESMGEYPGSSETRENDLLPSAGAIFEVVTNMNLRVSYGKTLARPTFREIGPPFFDFANDEIVVGNPDLEQSSIDNYDFRWEWFRRPGEVLAASAFYKVVEKPIEKTIVTSNGQVQYQNRDEATLYGFELEGRTQLDFLDEALTHFNVGANFAWIESEVDASPREYDNYERGKGERQLQGQSPFIFNADITYANPDAGLTMSLFFNVFGERLSEVSDITPNVFEQPVQTFDFTASKKLTKNMTLKFAAKNLFDPEFEKTIDFEGQKYIYSSYTKGRTFSIGLSYKW